MSVADKIKELQRVQLKIELYERLALGIAQEVVETPPTEDDLDLHKEFAEEVVKFAKARVDQLNGITPKEPAPKPRPEFQPLQPEKVKAPTPPPEPAHEDPLTFALKWKKNEGKEVEFTTKDGVIKARVRGVNPPNIVVETESNMTVTIPPSELTIKG